MNIKIFRELSVPHRRVAVDHVRLGNLLINK